MKKLMVIAIAVGLIGVLSIGAYAHYQNSEDYRSGRMMSGPRGGMYGHRGGYGHGWMGGRGPKGKWQASADTCPCGRHGSWQEGWSRWNAPDQPETAQQAPQVISEDKAKEAAEAYVTKYLPGYTIDKIEKDSWRPLYVVTVKGENNAELQILVHGFDGKVMHMFPKTAE